MTMRVLPLAPAQESCRWAAQSLYHRDRRSACGAWRIFHLGKWPGGRPGWEYPGSQPVEAQV